MTTIYTDQIIAVNRNDLSLAPHLILKGVWEMELSRKCEHLVASTVEPVIFDVGANYGWYGLILSRFSAASSVHFFEANPNLVELIKKTISVNGLVARAHIEHSAVGFADGATLTLNVPRFHMGSASCKSFRPEVLSQVFESEAEVQTFQVNTCSLDQSCETKGISSIDFMKIDVEGAEENVLLGAKNIIEKSSRLNIMMEWNRCYSDKIMEVVKGFSGCEGLALNGQFVNLSQILCDSSTVLDFESRVSSLLSKPSSAFDLFFMK